jgi:hypothetical protein
MEFDLSEVVRIVLAVLLAGFAGSQVADTWLNGSLFAKPVKWLHKRREHSWAAELLTCGFCLRHWTTLICYVFVMPWQADVTWLRVAFDIVCWLAAVRVSVLFEREVVEEIDEREAVEAIEIDWKKEQELLAREQELRQAEEELLQEEMDEAECSINLNNQI